MKVEKIAKTHWCCICDNAMSEVEIANNGGLKLFWACGPMDKEITLCKHCFKELKRQINAIEF